MYQGITENPQLYSYHNLVITFIMRETLLNNVSGSFACKVVLVTCVLVTCEMNLRFFDLFQGKASVLVRNIYKPKLCTLSESKITETEIVSKSRKQNANL